MVGPPSERIRWRPFSLAEVTYGYCFEGFTRFLDGGIAFLFLSLHGRQTKNRGDQKETGERIRREAITSEIIGLDLYDVVLDIYHLPRDFLLR